MTNPRSPIDTAAEPAAETLIDILRRRAGAQGEDVVYTFLDRADAAPVHLTYEALWARVRAVAWTLTERGLVGERAIIACPPGPGFAPAFFGAMFVGTIAAPAPPFDPTRPARSLARLQAIVRDARPRALLTTSTADVPDALAHLLRIDVDRLAPAPDGFDPRRPDPDSLAYLQYTSGSTADPKGVMLSHANLWWNCHENDEAYAIRRGSTMVCWVPPFHDMGLLYAIAAPVFGGAHCVSLPAAEFLRRPVRWMQVISDHRATHTVAPNAAYDLVALRTRPEERAALDLSMLHMALNGAEPIRHETEQRLVETFGPHGWRRDTLSHALGMAEATAKVSAERAGDRMRFAALDAGALARGEVVDADGDAPVIHVASCGIPTAHTRVVAVDVGRPLGDDAIGELWIQGPSVGQGYFERPTATAETFGGTLDGHPGTWLRTGDLGFVRNRRVYVTGRVKDVIIIRGLNYYPQDVEGAIAGCHPALRPGLAVAVGIPGEAGEALAIIAEVRSDDLDGPEVVSAVLGRIAEHGLRPVTIALCRRGSVEKTTSGKLRRRTMRGRLLEDALDLVHRWDAGPRQSISVATRTDAPSLGDLLAAIRAVHGDPALRVDPERPLNDIGFDSVMLADYAARVETLVGRPIPMPVFFDHPSPARLLAWLGGEHQALDPEPSSASIDDDPIVIASMACRLPGGIHGPEDLWRLLDDGIDAIVDFPDDRGWDPTGLFDADPDAVGRTYVTRGGFIDGIGDFDPQLFGISPREAQLIDPQQRLLLELAWEALERAGLAPKSLSGEPVGLYVGLWNDGYDRLAPSAAEATDGYALLGSAPSVAAGRIAYALGLEGPAVTVDTACSSSLVALHQAAKALRDHECDVALAGGATVFPTPDPFIWFSRLRTLAPDGRSKAFAAAADGAGWSEGAGLVVLTRLGEARRRGLPVLAVVRGSAINQDGRSQGLTAPNGPSQQRLIHAALASAGLGAGDVDAVEAFGTGTPLGDSIEAGALLATYGQRDPSRPLQLGALKSNLGHTQAAAGIAGVMKMVLALGNERLPATLHVDAPSPQVDWSQGAIELLTEAVEWPRGSRPRRAGVSSFGISGTNAHVIIEEAPADSAPTSSALAEAMPLLISGHTAAALRDQARRWAEWLGDHPEADIDAMRRAAALGRSHLAHRAAVHEPYLEGLKALAAERPTPNVTTGAATSRTGAVFVCPGHGSQWSGMGRALLSSTDAIAAPFAEAVDACDAALAVHTGWSVRAVLAGAADAPALERVDVVQPALFAMSIGLAALWGGCGIEPVAVVGHSVGEVAAAVIAGALTLEDGARLVALRGRHIAEVLRPGAMLATGLSAEALAERLDGTGLAVAMVNGPASAVASGDADAVAALAARLERDGVSHRRLQTGFAAHSDHIDGIVDAFADAIGDIAPRAGTVPMYSAVTGDRVDGPTLDAHYWRRNVRDVVRFDRAVAALARDGHGVFVELGGHPVLTAALGVADATVVGSLRREAGIDRLYRALGVLHVAGCVVDWTRLVGAGAMAALPTMAFQRQRYWLDEAPRVDVSTAGLEPVDHPLLRAALEVDDDGAVVLTGRVRTARHRWLGDHRVRDAAILPGTALLDLTLAAGRAVGADRLAELVLERALPLPRPDEGDLRLQVRVGAPGASTRAVSVHARSDDHGPWTCHARGLLAAGRVEAEPLTDWSPQGRPIDIEDLYARLSDAGLDYGPSFRNLRAAWRGPDAIWVEVAVPDGANRWAQGLHPALLDAALHALAIEHTRARLPSAWTDVDLMQRGAGVLRCRLRPGPGAGAPIEIGAWDRAGNPVLTATLTTRPAASGASWARDLYRIDWRAQPLPSASPTTDRWAVIGEGADLTGIARVDDVDAVPAGSSRLLIDMRQRAAVGPTATALAALQMLQAVLADPRLARIPVVWLTRGAVSIGPGDDPVDLDAAPIWGLLRTARMENPDRLLRLVDASPGPVPLACVTLDHEPEVAIRFGVPHAPRIVDDRSGDHRFEPLDGPWRLDPGARQGLDSIGVVSVDEAPLTGDMVEIEVRAAGMNFRDVLNAVGMVPTPWLGLELAGVVIAIGPEVDDLRPGDRVMGLGERTFATRARAGRWGLTRIPAGLSFVEAATVPVVYLTALYGLLELAALKPGERVLIHAAAGGVGMAALQIARHVGAEVFATATAPKWPHLRALGIADDHLASSRTLEFESTFMATTDGAGVDVVLDALAGDLVDASLRLLPRGGRFVEMGKTDVRDPEAVAGRYPGVVYRAFDLSEVGPAQTRAMLETLAEWLDRRVIRPLPRTVYDLGLARTAFDHMFKARHVGKVVLRPPRPLRGPALVTGGLGELGRAVALHLAETHGVDAFVLTSRRGPQAPGSAAVVDALAEHGARATVVACDITDRVQVAALFDDHDIGSVFHLAGVLGDGIIPSLSADDMARVMAPKVDGAAHLHRSTAERDLSAFVMFSSLAGTFGSPGQGNYAAANAYLDALAAHRRAQGLPGQSLAWGLWSQQGLGMTAHLGSAELQRMARNGFLPLPTADALALLDAALARPDATLVPVRLDRARLSARDDLPSLWSQLVPRAGSAGRAATPSRRSDEAAADLHPSSVRRTVAHAAAVVLGHGDPAALDPHTGFIELGLDSLMAVELRNRLKQALGLELASMVAFDHPTIERLTRHIIKQHARGTDDGSARRSAPAPTPSTMARAHDGAVALVGIGLRLPGSISDLDDLWARIEAGAETVGPVPSDRFDIDAVYDPRPGTPGRTYVRHASLLDDVAAFDAPFFGIGPAEATAMDPQQRLLLETAWEALEGAGFAAGEPDGVRTGVFVGIAPSGYGAHATDDSHRLVARPAAFAAGRLAHTLRLTGPALSVDTTCSSSLVALHLAVRALRDGQCERALAAGVQVLVGADGFITLSDAGVLAPDGRCKPFSAAADGFGRGEGAIVVALMLAERAREEGRPILGIVRGTAINHNGGASSMTAPRGPAQEAVIRAALADAGLMPGQVDAVECQGTGTPFGDPIELNALSAVYGVDRPRPLPVGTVKAVVGHTESAAGLAGVAGALAVLRARALPPMPHTPPLSPHVDWASSGLVVPTAPIRWPAGRPRRMAVSAFGMSGTNAHVILEAPPVGPAEAHPVSAIVPLLISGHDAGALRAQARRWADWLGSHRDVDLDAVRRSAALRRQQPERAAIEATGRAEIRAALEALARGERHAALEVGRASTVEAATFICPPSLVVEPATVIALGRASAAFAGVIEACDAIAREVGGWSLRDVLEGGGHAPRGRPLDHFAVTVGLAELWRELGLTPTRVVGPWASHPAIEVITGALDLKAGARRVLRAVPGESTPSRAAGAPSAARRESEDVAESRRVASNAAAGGARSAQQVELPRVLLGEAAIEDRGTPPLDTGEASGGGEVHIVLGSGPSATRGPDGSGLAVIESLGGPAKGLDGLRRAMMRLHVLGYALDWPRVVGPGALASLPTTPFQRRRFWLDPPTAAVPAAALTASAASRTEATPEAVSTRLRALVAEVVGVPATELAVDERFDELGVTSLSKIRLGREIHRIFGVEVRSSALYDTLGTLDTLTAWVVERASFIIDAGDVPEIPSSRPAGLAALRAVLDRLGPDAADVLATGPGSEEDVERTVSALRDAMMSLHADGWWADPPRPSSRRNQFRAHGVSDSPQWGCLTRIRAGDGLPPLVLFAALSGSAHVYDALVRALDPARPVWVAEAPEIAGHPSPPMSMEGLGQLYADACVAAGLSGPVHMAGYSFGAHAAAETARCIRARGVDVAALVLIDAPVEHPPLDEDAPQLEFLARHVGLDPAVLYPMTLAERVETLAAFMDPDGDARGHVEAEIWQVVEASRNNRVRAEGARVGPSDLATTLLWTKPAESIVAAWSALDRPVNAIRVPGDHVSCIRPPLVDSVARVIEQVMAEAEGPRPGV